MKTFVAILALAAVAAADVIHVVNKESDAQVLKQNADVFPDQYSFSYETSNGIQAQESGVLTNVGSEKEAIAVRGSNAYVGPDGVRYEVTYVADENGFQPSAAHFPTPPAPVEIPEYIVRALEYIRTHPAPPPKPTKF